MSSTVQKAFLQLKWQPMIQFVRYRRINFRRPRPPHYMRKLVFHVCEPQFEKPKKTIQELCLKPVINARKLIKKENPFQTLIARELINWLNNSNCTYIFQQNVISPQEVYQARVAFKKQDMCLRYYDKDTMTEAFINNNRYEALLPLLEGSSLAVGFGSEPKVSSVLKIIKKFPQFILIAGIIDNRLLSLSEMMEYKRIPNLQTAQAEFVSVLDSTALQLVQNLNQSQQALVSHLDKHVELKDSEDK